MHWIVVGCEPCTLHRRWRPIAEGCIGAPGDRFWVFALKSTVNVCAPEYEKKKNRPSSLGLRVGHAPQYWSQIPHQFDGQVGLTFTHNRHAWSPFWFAHQVLGISTGQNPSGLTVLHSSRAITRHVFAQNKPRKTQPSLWNGGKSTNNNNVFNHFNKTLVNHLASFIE